MKPTFGSKPAGSAVQPCTCPHWLEIYLIDQDDHPVPWEAFVAILPDGRRVEGTLDARGYARLERIPAGDCRVTFPSVDREEITRIA